MEKSAKIIDGMSKYMLMCMNRRTAFLFKPPPTLRGFGRIISFFSFARTPTATGWACFNTPDLGAANQINPGRHETRQK